jgi:hypothetical protein
MAPYTSPSHDETTAEFDQVQPGENFQMFCERTGVHPDRVLDLNRDEMTEHARVRGFEVGFMRAVPDENGGAMHESGQRVSYRPDYHVFVGQVLRLRPHEED